MSSMHKCWSLFNKEDKLRIDDLSVEQVRTILLAIPTSRMRDWFACREGEVHWQALVDISDFYEDVRAAKGNSYLAEEKEEAPPLAKAVGAPAAKAPSARRPLFEDAPDAQTEATLQMESVNTKERRSARRYARRLVFRVFLGSKKFEAQTVDISMGGLSLADPLPQGLGKNFRAELSFNGVDMQIVCSRVTETQLKLLEAEAWDVLRQWIANW